MLALEERPQAREALPRFDPEGGEIRLEPVEPGVARIEAQLDVIESGVVRSRLYEECRYRTRFSLALPVNARGALVRTCARW